MKSGNATFADAGNSTTPGIVCGIVAGKIVPQPPSRLLTPDQMSLFAKTEGTPITLNGKPFYFGGSNIYRLFYVPQSDLPTYFQDAVRVRSSVIRTWCFCDGIGCTQNVHFTDSQNGELVFNDDTNTGLGRMDAVIHQAQLAGVKLILTLTNNWSDFGGIDFYVAKFSNSVFKFHSDFYTQENIKSQFKRWINHVLTRNYTITGIAYKDDPTILAWELGNEFRCTGSGLSLPDQWNSSNEPDLLTNTLRWINDHYTVSQKVNKPIYVGEYGIVKGNQRLADFPQIQSLIQQLGMSGSLMWLLQSVEDGHQCQETADSTGKTYGLCANDPDAYTILINHGINMLYKSNQ
ncbi:hypothetical protein HK103_002700 [Boothiomyces macroporosus]|uniref:mannan endo-1,4-beta-mannosidase n=1 Tax=Boothiomyces macroporosus TaxID=261099 RepID=A0AAD5Y6H6_9FUNG|nr:hypothetical protein HK103_002700 [Boothiomyces macroporosus]